MRRLGILFVAAAFVVPVAVVSVFAQAYGNVAVSTGFISGDPALVHQPLMAGPDVLAGVQLLFGLPAALLGLVAGATLRRWGASVLLVPLGGFVLLPVAFDWSTPTMSQPLVLAINVAPYAIGWLIGWLIGWSIRWAMRNRRAPASGPNWTSPDVKRRAPASGPNWTSPDVKRPT